MWQARITTRLRIKRWKTSRPATEDSGSGIDEGSEDDDRIEKLQGIVADVAKQLAGLKKKKKKRKKTKKKGDRRRKSNTVEPAQILKVAQE